MAFEDDIQRISNRRNYIPNVEIKDYVMIDGKNFFDQPIKDNNRHMITYENIGKIATGQGDYIQRVVFWDISILKIIKDLRKQQPLDADLKAIQKN